LLAACSGTGPGAVVEGAPDAASDSAVKVPLADGGGAYDAASSPMDATIPPPADASSSDATTPPIDDRIDPIVVGHAWTYDVTEIGADTLCPSGEHTGTALDESTQDGQPNAIRVTSLCANVGASYYTVNGDVVQVDVAGTWVLALDAPVQEGHTWSNGVATFTWHDAGAVTVPAGTFTDCWSATENVAYESYTIFCRGVGPVHWYSKDAIGNGFDAVLKSKNF
jgi:hypothetical protein